LGHDSKKVRVSSQGLVQPNGHGEYGSCAGLSRGVQFNDVGHVFDALLVYETGDMTVWQLFDELGHDAKPFPDRDPNLDSVSIDDVSLWWRRQCLLV